MTAEHQRKASLARWYGEYQPLRCPRCRGKHTYHRGYYKSPKAGPIQLWACRDCGRCWQERRTTTHTKKKIHAANQPRCGVCKGPIPKRRRRFCCDEHYRIGKRAWEDRHKMTRRTYYRRKLRRQSLAGSRPPNASGMANLGGGGQTGSTSKNLEPARD